MAAVRFSDVLKRYGEVDAVRHLSLEIADGEFMVLVGPSGSGKTTALRMLAGLESISGGEISIGERVVNRIAPRERDIAMVFQDYALYPQMTVFDNLAFGLRRRKVPKEEIAGRVATAAGLLDIGELLERKPGQLSGGQAQRVALGRALVRQPQVFLMDEPLSNLDAKLRAETRAELIALHQRLEATFVYVTHDQIEAMTMATRVVVLRDGLVQQVGRPQEVYDRPANTFVASFMGTPPMNVFPAGALDSGPHRVGVRPEHLELTAASSTTVTAIVALVEALGHERLVLCDLPTGERVTARLPAGGPAPTDGDAVHLGAAEAHRHRFDATTGERLDDAGGRVDVSPAPVPTAGDSRP